MLEVISAVLSKAYFVYVFIGLKKKLKQDTREVEKILVLTTTKH